MLFAPAVARSRSSGWRAIVALAVVLPLLLAVTLASAQSPGLSVASITVQGQPAQSVADVQVRAPGAARGQAHTIKAGQVLAPGAELTLPRGATGEAHQPLGGTVEFQVKHALDYFNISYDRFTAAVKGTAYSVEIDPANALKFSVTEGVVEVERQVQIKIAGAVRGAQARDTSARQGNVARIAEDLKAGQSKSYKLNVAEYLDEFKNFGDAEAYFTQALNEAQASGDKRRMARAVFNLMLARTTMGRPQAALELKSLWP